MMVHIGEPPPTLNQVFDLLRPGDIVTHCFNGKNPGSISDSPQIFANAKRLAEEGVYMDVGHGAASYNFKVAKEAIANGLKPYSISTDLHGWNLNGPVYDLATTVSKLYAAGLSLDECVNAVTCNPRNFLALKNAATLAIGNKADFTIFDVNDCDEQVSDSQGNEMTMKSAFEPKMVISGAKTFLSERTKTPQNNS
jgi:dihydroorotase